ncbi:MAG: hypothetical protein M0Z40_12220 [Actinomycetota bacterium]|nr:hypothetical protein [Actinomycetota bacterium]MDA8314455.1 hypothetical protein [Actinomycetota bacterium]
MTPNATDLSCAICGAPATGTVEPARKTLARGLDPADPSYSVTVILPDIALCAAHTHDLRDGGLLVGWCDDPRCRMYGEIGEPSPCGDPYTKVGARNRA